MEDSVDFRSSRQFLRADLAAGAFYAFLQVLSDCRNHSARNWQLPNAEAKPLDAAKCNHDDPLDNTTLSDLLTFRLQLFQT